LQAAERGYVVLEDEYHSRLAAATTDQQKEEVHKLFEPRIKEGALS
jgi:hypothetical protein